MNFSSLVHELKALTENVHAPNTIKAVKAWTMKHKLEADSSDFQHVADWIHDTKCHSVSRLGDMLRFHFVDTKSSTNDAKALLAILDAAAKDFKWRPIER